MGVLLGGMATPVSSAPGPMPPKLDAAGVEAFLGCQFFVEQGVQWLVAQVRGKGVEACGTALRSKGRVGGKREDGRVFSYTVLFVWSVSRLS